MHVTTPMVLRFAAQREMALSLETYTNMMGMCAYWQYIAAARVLPDGDATPAPIIPPPTEFQCFQPVSAALRNVRWLWGCVLRIAAG